MSFPKGKVLPLPMGQSLGYYHVLSTVHIHSPRLPQSLQGEKFWGGTEAFRDGAEAARERLLSC